MKIVFKPLCLLILLSACDEPAADADAGAAGCVESALLAQCPVGANPLIGAQAEATCDGAAQGWVQDGAGQTTGQCYGVGSCRVICQFAVPCRCGVMSISHEGVVCASCEGAAACGNGMCEGGENPMSCAIDCGPACNPGERRCDGEALQECSLQGRFDTLPCPRGEVCDAAGETPRCISDPHIIMGGDAGVGDGGVGPAEGRLSAGDGTWPRPMAPPVAAPFPRNLQARETVVYLDDGSIRNAPTDFARAMTQAGGTFLWQWRLMPGPEGLIEGLGRVASIRLDAAGALQLHHGAEYPLADAEAFCATFMHCFGQVPEQCPAAFERWGAGDDGLWRRNCVTVVGQETCEVFEGSEARCVATPLFFWPQGAQIGVNENQQSGERLLGVAPDQRGMVAIDLDTGVEHTQAPVGDFLIPQGIGFTALSADGRIAAAIATQGIDSVIVIWDIENGVRRAIIPLSGASVFPIALSPDGQVLAMVASGGDPLLQRAVSLWNIAEERRIVSIRQPALDPGAPGQRVLLFSPNGRELAIDVEYQAVTEIWALGAAGTTLPPEKRQTLPLDGERILAAAYAADGTTLALYGPFARQVSLWDTQNGQRWRTLDPGNTDLRTLRFSDDGQRLLTVYQESQLNYTFRVYQP